MGSAAPIIAYVLIENVSSWAIYSQSTNPVTFKQGEIKSSINGIYASSGYVDARNTNWNDVTGPYHTSDNPSGRGAKVQGNVIFKWWQGIDTDEDGLPDYFEILFGLNPNVANNTNVDLDGDGLSLLQEFKNGTAPNNIDTDGDGLPDDWEVANGTNPLIDDASLDTDGDGLTNLEEMQNGTNPLLADTDGDGVNDNIDENPNDPLRTGLDTDGDGMKDDFELLHNLDINDPFDAHYDNDNDSLPNLHEYLEQLVPTVKDNNVYQKNALFVRQIYADIIGLYASESEVTYWKNILLAKTLDKGEIAGALSLSNEANEVQLISTLYQSLFKRLPSVDELSVHIINYHQGLSHTAIAESLLNTNEYLLENAELSDGEFIDYLFDSVFNREPTIIESINWGLELMIGSPRASLTAEFVHSQAVAQKWRYPVLVDLLFKRLLRRAPTTSEQEHWVDISINVDKVGNLVRHLMSQTVYYNRFMPTLVTGDADGDGLSNEDELSRGLDPTNPDSDNDGMSDGFEVTYGFNPLLDSDAALDSDYDGLTNLEEYQAGTDPTNSDTDGDGIKDGLDDDPLVPFVGEHLDINQNGKPDIHLLGSLSNGKKVVMFYDSLTGAQTGVVYIPSWFSTLQVEVLSDINANGFNDIAILGSTSDGKKAWLTFDTKTGKLLTAVTFPAWFQPSQLAVVPDYNGNDKDELLVLGQTSDGKKVWMLHDSGLKAELGRYVYPSWYSPSAVSIVKDTDGNNVPEVVSSGTSSDGRSTWMLHDLESKAQLRAVKQAPWFILNNLQQLDDVSGNTLDDVIWLGNTTDGKNFFKVEDANTGTLDSTYIYPNWYTPSMVTSQQDTSGNGYAEIVSLGITSDGKKAWLAHDAYNHTVSAAKVFPAWYQPQTLKVLPDVDGDGIEDILVRGSTSDGKSVIMVQSGATGADIKIMVLPSWFVPM